MNVSLCPINAAIDPIATILYLLLVISAMIFIVQMLWKRHQPSCAQQLFGPIFLLLILSIILVPVGGVIAWYTLRLAGTEATAIVIDHRISPDAKAIYPHQIDFLYQIQDVDGSTCAIIQRKEPVTAQAYTEYPIGSSIAIRYLAYNPAIAHTDDAERVAWMYVLGEAIVMVCAGIGAYIKQRRR